MSRKKPFSDKQIEQSNENFLKPWRPEAPKVNDLRVQMLGTIGGSDLSLKHRIAREIVNGEVQGSERKGSASKRRSSSKLNVSRGDGSGSREEGNIRQAPPHKVFS